LLHWATRPCTQLRLKADWHSACVPGAGGAPPGPESLRALFRVKTRSSQSIFRKWRPARSVFFVTASCLGGAANIRCGGAITRFTPCGASPALQWVHLNKTVGVGSVLVSLHGIQHVFGVRPNVSLFRIHKLNDEPGRTAGAHLSAQAALP